MPNQRIDRFLTAAQVALDNARKDAELRAGLARVGYDDVRLDQGYALLQAALAMHTRRHAEHGDQIAATAALEQARAAARTVYMRHVVLARVAFKDDPGALAALGLNGRRSSSLSRWLVQARQFYDNLLASGERKARLADLGQTEERLLEGKALVDAVAALNTEQEQEKGDAQRAVQQRDDAFDALDGWMRDFGTVARVAFAADRQQLEKLGFVARS